MTQESARQAKTLQVRKTLGKNKQDFMEFPPFPMTFPFFLNFPPKNKDLKSESSYLMVFAHQIFLCKLTLSNRIGILFIFFQICPLRTNSSPTAFISCKILLFCQALYKTLIIKVAIFFFF